MGLERAVTVAKVEVRGRPNFDLIPGPEAHLHDHIAHLLAIGTGVPHQGTGEGSRDSVETFHADQTQAIEPANEVFKLLAPTHLDLASVLVPPLDQVFYDQALQAAVGKEHIASIAQVKNGESFLFCPGLSLLQLLELVHLGEPLSRPAYLQCAPIGQRNIPLQGDGWRKVCRRRHG